MPFVPVRPRRDDAPLLYSLAEFAEIIFACFEAAEVSTIVEIGAEAGLFTDSLVTWVRDHRGHLTSIDPAPSTAARRFVDSCPQATLEVGLSVDVLPRLAPAHAYLIDGDHNYHTVRAELEAISSKHERAQPPPLVFAQDLSWPSGWRDQYYNPDGIPDHARHPYAFGGVLPWSDDVGVGGFRGAGHFAFACHEGGPVNGVATAIDDFLADHEEYTSLVIPAIFGLAILFPADASWADDLVRRLGAFDDHPLLRRLEANRLWLYLRVIELEDCLATQGRAAAARADKAVDLADRWRRELEISGQEVIAARAERDRLAAELAFAKAQPIESSASIARSWRDRLRRNTIPG